MERSAGSGGGGPRAATRPRAWKRGTPFARSITWRRALKSICSASASRGAVGVALTPGFLRPFDDRPSALVPVAGITDMTNHVVDGVIEGHCDCMYQVNTYGWDFSLLAALAAPRPLLLANSDKDRIFPLDGVLRIHRQLKSIYKLFNAEDKLGLLITEGPHRDTQDLQVPAFRWMNRWLKKEEALINHAAVPRFSPEAVKVFKTIPADQINTSVHESFVPAAPVPAVPGSTGEWSRTSADWLQLLRDKVFRNWPNLTTQTKTHVTSDRVRNQIRVRLVEFQPDEAYLLTAVLLTDTVQKPSRLSARILDNSELQKWGAFGEQYFPELPIQPVSTAPAKNRDRDRRSAENG